MTNPAPESLDSFVVSVIEDVTRPGHGMQRIDHARHIVALLHRVIIDDIPGDLAELGCNAGLSAVLLSAAIDSWSPGRKLHAFDSFEGLPAPQVEDGAPPHGKASCKASLDQFRSNFGHFKCALPEVHPGWFSETLATGLPEQLAFVHLDADLYQSTVEGLTAVWPRLSPGGIIVLHDFIDPADRRGIPDDIDINQFIEWPGVMRACSEFFTNKPESVELLLTNGRQCGQGYVRKLLPPGTDRRV